MSDWSHIYSVIHIVGSSGYGVLSYLKSQTLLDDFFWFWLLFPWVVPHITTLDSSEAWAKSRIKVFPGILPGCIKASIIIQRYTFLEICTVQDTGRNKLPRSTRIAHTTQNQRCSAWICLLDAIPNRGICPSPTIQTPKAALSTARKRHHDKVVSEYVFFCSSSIRNSDSFT